MRARRTYLGHGMTGRTTDACAESHGRRRETGAQKPASG